MADLNEISYCSSTSCCQARTTSDIPVNLEEKPTKSKWYHKKAKGSKLEPEDTDSVLRELGLLNENREQPKISRFAVMMEILKNAINSPLNNLP